MVIVYATLIVKEKLAFKDTPESLKERVRQVLIDMDVPELIKE